MSATKLVIVEDDDKLREMLADYFQTQGFDVATTGDGMAAPALIEEVRPDLVLLDLMLPGLDGLTICRQIRTWFTGKVLMLTASDDDFDHVAALETGTDDFVTKPIKPRVLLARIRMLLRRTTAAEVASSNGQLQFGGLVLSQASRSCVLLGDSVTLTDSEFDLLWLLAQSAGDILSRDALTKALRGIDYDGIDRSVDNRIVALRKKLEGGATDPKGIITVRGKGYLFVADAW
ncbi:response regulator [Vibrio tapetis subsp. quintayensis]|uniref:response regulator n=1 Tax=Vibrio tapetis TaxID=52443 RepID=UPI0025B2EF78|nr:response regulator [Vibrio tapetis]MDN3681178.1 response regulator [Vibrio tapetis subsp. quintayensis]